MDSKRLALTKAVMELLDSWSLSAKEKLVLLGLPDDVKSRHMEQFRTQPFPETDKVNEHLIHIVGIEDALRTMYPRNTGMGKLWLKKEHKRLSNKVPMQLMTTEGLAGIKKVRAVLDCTYEWAVNSQ